MNTQNLLTLTLIISGLSLNPVMAQSQVEHRTQNQNTQHSLRGGISTHLHNRGLEEDAAKEIAEAFIADDDENLIAKLMATLQLQKIASREDILSYLSMAALHREKIDFRKPEALETMLSTIEKKVLTQESRRQLHDILNRCV